MGSIKIPYYVVRNGIGYWQAKKAMRDAGFGSVTCGPDGPEAWAYAKARNDAWQAYRRGDVDFGKDSYPRGSIGDAWTRYRRTSQWAEKSAATRNEWEKRAWKWIGTAYGDVDPRTITLEGISELRDTIEAKISNREAHRVIKVWRALWKVMAALGYCERDADPSLGLRNRATKGATATWEALEVWQIIRQAWREGYTGVALAVSLMWDTGCSPVDARTAVASQIAKYGPLTVYCIERAKTGKPAIVPLSRRTVWLLGAMERQTGLAMIGEAVLVRRKSGIIYDKNYLGRDFRLMRAIVFGQEEKRQMQHIRRTAASEAIDGDISKEHLSGAMANTIGHSNQLWETYVKPSPVSGIAFQEARRKGRKNRTDKG